MDIPHYCQTVAESVAAAVPWDSLLHPTALSFVQKLDLPKIHPQCLLLLLFNSTNTNTNTSISTNSSTNTSTIIERNHEDPLPNHAMGPEYYYEREMGVWSQWVTLFHISVPALWAMAELWLRLFACLIAPMVGTWLVIQEIRDRDYTDTDMDTDDDDDHDNDGDTDPPRHVGSNRSHGHGRYYEMMGMILGLAASAVLFTDTMYVQAYGRSNGGLCLLLFTFLCIKRSNRWRRHNMIYKRRFLRILVAWILSVVLYLYVHSDRGGGSRSLYHDHHPGIDIATIQEGLYVSSENAFMRRVAELWPPGQRIYDKKQNASPLPTGDSMTGIPFLINSAPEQEYVRLWVPSTHDREAVAVDLAFPPNGVHSDIKPVYLVLHGLNGGSHEEYVREFVVRRVREGHTCIVMIARGLMDTPVFGWNVFHGARITDVEDVARAIRRGLGEHQILAGVGYSMGAIILSNYVARSGGDCYLDCAMAISGGLDMRENLNFRRSMRLWQPMLAQTLKEDFIVRKFDGRFRQRLTKEQHLALMRASSVSDVDVHAIVTYNGFQSLLHYYSEMSAMGDTDAFQRVGPVSTTCSSGGTCTNSTTTQTNRSSSSSRNQNDVGRIGNVSIPFCVMHALDDPLTTWRTLGHDPQRLVQTGSGHIMMFLTKSGGHVGWPLGLNPASSGWKFMNDAVSGFVNGVNQARMEWLERGGKDGMI